MKWTVLFYRPPLGAGCVGFRLLLTWVLAVCVRVSATPFSCCNIICRSSCWSGPCGTSELLRSRASGRRSWRMDSISCFIWVEQNRTRVWWCILTTLPWKLLEGKFGVLSLTIANEKGKTRSACSPAPSCWGVTQERHIFIQYLNQEDEVAKIISIT